MIKLTLEKIGKIKDGDKKKEWKKFINHNTIKIYYSNKGSSDECTYYVEKFFNNPIQNVISVLAHTNTNNSIPQI